MPIRKPKNNPNAQTRLLDLHNLTILPLTMMQFGHTGRTRKMDCGQVTMGLRHFPRLRSALPSVVCGPALCVSGLSARDPQAGSPALDDCLPTKSRSERDHRLPPLSHPQVFTRRAGAANSTRGRRHQHRLTP